MATHKQSKQEQARAEINEERFGALFPEFKKITVTRVICELFVSLIWGYALGMAFNGIMMAVMLLNVPVFFLLFVYFALMAIMLYVAFSTAGYVATTVCDAGAAGIALIGVGFDALKRKHADAKAAYAECGNVRELFGTFKQRNFA